MFFTALAGAKGLSGHTGGAYDTVPEVMIIRAFIAGGAPIVPIFFDEAGHRVATQYLLSVLDGAHAGREAAALPRVRPAACPATRRSCSRPGVKFSSGRLGHMWAFCNGVAMANPGKAVIMLGSDGSQMEGDNAEAARLAVGKQLNVKVLVDDNNVTIAGHPQRVHARLRRRPARSPGTGCSVETVMGEDLDELYAALAPRVRRRQARTALVIKRKMAPGIEGAEGSPHAPRGRSRPRSRSSTSRSAATQAAVEMLKSGQARQEPADLQGLAAASARTATTSARSSTRSSTA